MAVACSGVMSFEATRASTAAMVASAVADSLVTEFERASWLVCSPLSASRISCPSDMAFDSLLMTLCSRWVIVLSLSLIASSASSSRSSALDTASVPRLGARFLVGWRHLLPVDHGPRRVEVHAHRLERGQEPLVASRGPRPRLELQDRERELAVGNRGRGVDAGRRRVTRHHKRLALVSVRRSGVDERFG